MNSNFSPKRWGNPSKKKSPEWKDWWKWSAQIDELSVRLHQICSFLQASPEMTKSTRKAGIIVEIFTVCLDFEHEFSDRYIWLHIMFIMSPYNLGSFVFFNKLSLFFTREGITFFHHPCRPSVHVPGLLQVMWKVPLGSFSWQVQSWWFRNPLLKTPRWKHLQTNFAESSFSYFSIFLLTNNLTTVVVESSQESGIFQLQVGAFLRRNSSICLEWCTT